MSSDPPIRKKVTINLSLSRTARAFGPDESLWDIELKKIYRLIRQHLAVLDAKDQERLDRPVRETSLDRSSLEEMPLLSIAIFGTYGSGKTSLLKTLVRESNREQKREDLNKPERGDLYALPLIEPNILAPDDHFLYAFLATALEEDLKHQDREERLASGSYRLSPVQQAFHKVSEYLQVIDPEKDAQESDPLGKSLERLDRHSSSFLLEQEMQRFISVLADELTSRRRTSVVLLAVDDADMSQENLIRILDTHRRYLQHPRLVPVFTFTSRLAEELLGVHFSEKLSTAKSQKMAESRQRGSSTTSLDLTEHLAYQYLVKLFPIRNRIRLGPAPARVQRGCFIPPRDSTQTNALESDACPQGSHQVMGLLAGASKLLFGHSEWPLTPRVRLSLRPSTLRRQLQVVDAMVDAQVGGIPWTGPKEPEGKGIGNPGGAHGSTSKKEAHDTLTWVKVFTGASWSLLNVHRDVLREVNLHMEDLYSWTPRGLRRAILGGILTLDPGGRETLIKRWRYRVESRRGQILSLLALVAFRPEMPGEEPSGDHPELTRKGFQEPPEGLHWNLKVTHATLWFLSLWTGFYLPQLLARGREIAESPKATGSQRIVGTGWSLRTGSIHAMREARESGEVFSTGMMRLDPLKVAELLNRDVLKLEREEEARAEGDRELEPLVLRDLDDLKAELEALRARAEEARGQADSLQGAGGDDGEQAATGDREPESNRSEEEDPETPPATSSKDWTQEDEKRLRTLTRIREKATKSADALLHFHIWGFYGYSGGTAWSAVSLWRGLVLLGQILEEFETSYNLESDQEGEGDEQESIPSSRKGELTRRVQHLILKHASWTRRPGLFEGGEQPTFRAWNLESSAADLTAQKLADDIVDWFKPYVKQPAWTLDPLVTDGAEEGPGASPKSKWRRSFIRRLHGEYLVGQFWPLLGGSYLGPAEKATERTAWWWRWDVARDVGVESWNARRALQVWLKALLSYMDTGVQAVKDDETGPDGGAEGDPVGAATEDTEKDRKKLEFNEVYQLLSTCPLLTPWLDEKPEPSWLDAFEELVVWDKPGAGPSEHHVSLDWPHSKLTVDLANVSTSGDQPLKVVIQEPPPSGTGKESGGRDGSSDDASKAGTSPTKSRKKRGSGKGSA